MDNPNQFSRKTLIFIQVHILLYALAIAIMCFTPQSNVFEGIKTPNIIELGQLRLLLVPFNSLISLGKVTSTYQLVWIFCQNVLNIFLLYPLIFLIHLLSSKWHSCKKSLVLGFMISLFIEVSQLLLDFLLNANRVFELDDLWTNALGAVLAYMTYYGIEKYLHKN
ncbi:VanZ family protein [Streptococcus didelphis]|uniref:VanZ family protein n=1 Tax=Streptococcus didelphis TaxID=102886 RepID=A0ABY9LIW8_9STRE|nr:VanZ family protein [Streptococcus didelphis]WMB28831.1 VanZ family protein [Streptococcus didelphis]WMB30163.1 VanZ family protein [Streptococcus didelphis]